MEKITYQKLKAGYILKDGDIIDILHGFSNLRTSCNSAKYWLHNPDGSNSAPYEYLGIADPKDGHSAPEFDSAEELTKHVISLFERAPYKVGDKVRILKREKASHEYPFSFVDEMNDLAGETFTIKRIELNTICDRAKYNGDFHQYHLDEPGDWNWHSSMFEKVDSDSEIKEESVPEKKYKYEDGQHLTICGKSYCVCRKKDNNFLSCDTYSNRRVFLDLGIISKIGEEDKLYKWIESHGFKHSDGSFPPIINEQFDDFVDLLLQMERDQGTVGQCQASEESYKLKDKVKLGECNYEILKNDRGYYLYNLDLGSNNEMFKELGIDGRVWLKSHDFDYNGCGVFPEQSSLEKLTQVIKALQKEIRFKKECKILEDAIVADAKPVSRGSELVWSVLDEIPASPEKLKFVKKKKNIHITL